MLSLPGFIILFCSHLVFGEPCNKIVTITDSWVGGYTTALKVHVKNSISTWEMDITFSSSLTNLEVWDARATRTNKNQYKLINDNGAQSAILIDFGFNVHYSKNSDSPPVITSIHFNDVIICSSGGISNSTPSTIQRAALPTKYKYTEAITKSLLFYYAQRSGRLVSTDNPIPYRSDSALNDRGQNGEDLTGGYYDAGDRLKLGFPMAAATTIVAWSIIDYPLGYSGELPRAQKMVKWATDYFIKAHVETNKFYGQVGDGKLDHNYWGRPEDMKMDRPAFFISSTKPGSDLAGETAAALAAVSIVFSSVDKIYSALCLTRAKQLYTLAKQFRGQYHIAISQAAEFYPSSGYGDELAWSAAWLYRATNDSVYLKDAETFYSQFGLGNNPSEFSWDSKEAGVQVMLAKLTGKSQYKNAAKTFCDSKVNQKKSPKGFLFISKWGSLRHAANIAFICLQAADLGINSLSYRQLAQKQIHYALGDTGRSFVVGFGVNPPVRPHHASSSCPNRPAACGWNEFSLKSPNPQVLYGALVGGPDANDNYQDVRSDYVTNEVSCDYNAGYQASLAALQSLAVQGIFN